MIIGFSGVAVKLEGYFCPASILIGLYANVGHVP